MIIAGNERNGDPVDCYGTLLSGGYNLIENPDCTVTGTTAGNIYNEDPQLEPLADNGGPDPDACSDHGKPCNRCRIL